MIATLTLTSMLLNRAQDPMMPPVPKSELETVSFLKGRFSGKGQGVDMQGKTIKITSTSLGNLEMGRWMNITYTYDLGSMGKMEGRLIFTYNATKKMYEGTWYDSMSESPMAFTGYTEGKYFVANSPHVMMGEMAMDMKIVYAKESANHYKLSVKSRPEGGDWMTAMDMDYMRR
ncbi:MAG: DUF1579 family protein [Armatimonadetes bacterium]|nr:DUF1579 family protein [Armatimonadota bacterium]MBS1710496.1 DUF1579 family protein [Armatimonadota bacterium]MBX3108167.1 DUF1579 family protein [Fimbriimonadaceae bacterium]